MAKVKINLDSSTSGYAGVRSKRLNIVEPWTKNAVIKYFPEPRSISSRKDSIRKEEEREKKKEFQNKIKRKAN